MGTKRFIASIVILSGLAASPVLLAHGGGLNAEGCHNDRKNGGYHCHRAQQQQPRSPPSPGGSRGAFANCSAARAVGAAPVREGDPGYGRHLDRDGDWIGCE
ncbi:excalibur calcium-binding domain-containing protein [Sphingobium sp. AN641]|uniref:excalibur calcium-binding domain-containing protein n=1 Tax=Sphingobium sp. AN641 TaxID=3133443 RepID=UPI0030BF2D62